MIEVRRRSAPAVGLCRRNGKRDCRALGEDGCNGDTAVELSRSSAHVLQTHTLCSAGAKVREPVAVVDDFQTDLIPMSPQGHHPLVRFGMTDAVAQRFLGDGQHMGALFRSQSQAGFIVYRDDDLSGARRHEGSRQRPKGIGDGLLENDGRLHVRNKRPHLTNHIVQLADRLFQPFGVCS